MSDELKKIGGGDPWPKRKRPLPDPEPPGVAHTSPCIVCGVDGDHHGVGEHFNVDHVYQRALSKWEEFLVKDGQYWRREAEDLYVENERLRAALGEISSIPGPGIVALRLIASAALSATAPAAERADDEELPGMWSRSDFTGGETDG